MSGRRGRGPGWAGYGDLTASLVLCFPLALAYGIGAALVDAVSAVDLPSRGLWWLCGGDRGAYWIAYLGIAAGFVVWLVRTGRAAIFERGIVVPLLLEAAIYAMTLAAVIDLVLARALGLALGAGAGVVTALGAGLHEEILFRGLGLAGLSAGLRQAGGAPRAAWAAAWVGSSLLFAAAHHWAGEPWDARSFGFRALAGAAFGLIFWFRSLAHAVWAHAFYDLYVLIVAR